MQLIRRLLNKQLESILKKGKSILLLVPHQTGKTTLINQYKANLLLFVNEYPKAKKGYVVCQTSRNHFFSNKIEAISWKDLIKKLHNW